MARGGPQRRAAREPLVRAGASGGAGRRGRSPRRRPPRPPSRAPVEDERDVRGGARERRDAAVAAAAHVHLAVVAEPLDAFPVARAPRTCAACRCSRSRPSRARDDAAPAVGGHHERGPRARARAGRPSTRHAGTAPSSRRRPRRAHPLAHLHARVARGREQRRVEVEPPHGEAGPLAAAVVALERRAVGGDEAHPAQRPRRQRAHRGPSAPIAVEEPPGLGRDRPRRRPCRGENARRRSGARRGRAARGGGGRAAGGPGADHDGRARAHAQLRVAPAVGRARGGFAAAARPRPAGGRGSAARSAPAARRASANAARSSSGRNARRIETRPSSTLTGLRKRNGKNARPKTYGTSARCRSLTTSARRARREERGAGRPGARRASKWCRKSEAVTTSNERVGEGQGAHVGHHAVEARRRLAQVERLHVEGDGGDRPGQPRQEAGRHVARAAADIEEAAAGRQVGAHGAQQARRPCRASG